MAPQIEPLPAPRAPGYKPRVSKMRRTASEVAMANAGGLKVEPETLPPSAPRLVITGLEAPSSGRQPGSDTGAQAAPKVPAEPIKAIQAPISTRPNPNPWGAPKRGESWGALIARVGDEFHGTAMVRNDSGEFVEVPVTLKEALVREAFKQAMGGNSKVMTEILRRMPNPNTGQPEGDPPSQVQISDWRTAAVKLIVEGRISPDRAVEAFGHERARQLFAAAHVDFNYVKPENLVSVEGHVTGSQAVGSPMQAFEPDGSEDDEQ